MIIRKAETVDAAVIVSLLHQVLEVHAALRPDLFITGTTKYNEAEVAALLSDSSYRVFVADENGKILGYAVCIIKDESETNATYPHKTFYIDDICVDEGSRGKSVGQKLFLRAKEEAMALSCYNITLNVWAGNDGARAFYEKMGLSPKKTEMELIL
ncbi:MAG: GNAT family N-acetyltransferase [Clostridia bacterium]|nr:GNAT family N-acetyltransferase [Clostridia bacterium]